jgi:ABC-2 type transport system ATP-binding protein
VANRYRSRRLGSGAARRSIDQAMTKFGYPQPNSNHAAGNDDSACAIEVQGIVKRFGDIMALDGVDLTARAGEVLGLLGPNGAGKTTLVRILTTLLKPDSGTARVLGFDVVRDAAQLREQIGLAGQYAAVDENLTGLENLTMVGRLYGADRKAAKARGEELLEQFDLVDAGRRPTKTYSGGMGRRLDLAAALVGNPPVVFLDEPTTGLDPRARLGMWEVIETLVAGGTTMLLTTQYLDEARVRRDGPVRSARTGRPSVPRPRGRSAKRGRRANGRRASRRSW